MFDVWISLPPGNSKKKTSFSHPRTLPEVKSASDWSAMLAVTSSHVAGDAVWLDLPGCHATHLLVRLLTHSLARSDAPSLPQFSPKAAKVIFFLFLSRVKKSFTDPKCSLF